MGKMEAGPLHNTVEPSPEGLEIPDPVWVEFLVGALRLAEQRDALDSENKGDNAPEATR